jgi:glycosyltransferase involved in cell wall biosynthesis
MPNTIPNPERLPADLPPAPPRTDGPRLLFAGHLSYPPNIAAAESLATRILPLLRRSLPTATLTIAGRSPAKAVARLAGGGVEIVADPPAMDRLLAAAHFAVMPLEAGGGTRIKALEAMAWGVPIVASARAVEGLGVRDRQTVRLAESPEDFCREIVALWNDPGACEAQRLAARDHALTEFSMANAERGVAAALRRATIG